LLREPCHVNAQPGFLGHKDELFVDFKTSRQPGIATTGARPHHSRPDGWSMKKILLVDDEEGLGSLLQRVLPEYELRHERTASTALLAAYSWQPDLFLVDLRMEDMDGAALARLIQRDPFLGSIPIFFISALLPCQDEPVTLDGCVAFGKPFRVEVLKRYIAEHLPGF
jgi:CheY-like chemotaxis protein